MKNLVVVAIGGNSLIKDKAHQTVEDQKKQIERTCSHIADLIEKGFEVVITHGNGPQIGFILFRSDVAKDKIHEVPLDSCGADTQGALGYQIQQSLDNEFRKRGITKPVVSVVTQVEVDAQDPAFCNPTKPIGQFFDKEDAELLKKQGWKVIEDSGRGWRRVVASPQPKKIIELDAIETLVKNGFVVIAVGGGGIPVARNEQRDLVGKSAVIDKDLASSLLASDIHAEKLIITTSVEKVALNFGKPEQQYLDELIVSEAKRYLQEGHFPAGSMGPKIQAAIDFLEHGGKEVIITSLEKVTDAVEGRTGTRIKEYPINNKEYSTIK